MMTSEQTVGSLAELNAFLWEQMKFLSSQLRQAQARIQELEADARPVETPDEAKQPEETNA